jgi:hypothetical protein
MARSALNPTLGQFVSLVGPSSPVKPKEVWEEDQGPLASYLQTKRPTEKQLLSEIEFSQSLPEIPSESLQKSDFLSAPNIPDKVAVEVKDESKPFSAKDRSDIAKSISSGLLEAGKGMMDLEKAKSDILLKTEMEKARGQAEAAQTATQSNVGGLRSYVANLRAALGR